MWLKVVRTIDVEAPEGASHYAGEDEFLVFYKKTEIGVVGDHWWRYNQDTKDWVFVGHNQPQWIKAIPPKGIIEVD